MFSSLRASVLLASLALVVQVHAIPKITRVGRYLYDDSGSRFYIKGIAYQEQGEVVQSPDNPFGEPSTYIDPLASPEACERDLPYLKELSVNTLRIYSVDSSKNHDACMKLFSDNGIYTFIDLALPLNGSIIRDAPSWSTNLLNQYIRTIDAFSKYDNVLGYAVGNEVVVQASTDLSPFVKAAARDIKAYLKSKGLNALVGYSAIDGESNFRGALANYLSCGSEETSIDIYGLNSYSWCGDSSFDEAYAAITNQFANYNVVAYLSEFGCISQPPRLWTEVDAIFGPQMSPVWSGGIAFSYFHARSEGGEFPALVDISADGKTVTGTTDDFKRLQTHYSAVTPPNSPAQSSAAASTYPPCAAPDGTNFVASNTLPPTPNESACNCVENALSCQFTNKNGNYSVVVGQLVGSTCGLLGGIGATCDDITSNGRTGVYGRVAGCDPTIKLSYIMSQYYEGNNRVSNACVFGNNATVNSGASSTVSAAAVASSCIANPSATFVPSAPSGTSPSSSGGGQSGNTPGGGSNSGGNGGNGGNNNSGAVSLSSNALVGLGLTALLTVGSTVLTLA